jgi:hypothetical protein
LLMERTAANPAIAGMLAAFIAKRCFIDLFIML